MSFAERKFKMLACAQGQSPLLRLPAELKVKILRNLMRRNGKLEVKWGSSRNSRKILLSAEALNLSGQLLSTCQRLFFESMPILYGENTLGVTCVKTQNVGVCLEILNGCSPIASEVGKFENGDVVNLGWRQATLDSSRFPADFDWKSKYDPSWLRNNAVVWGAFRRNLPAISNFRKLYLSLIVTSQEEMFVTCRVLKNLVYGKSVEFHGLTAEHMRLPAACRLWRCNQLKFLREGSGAFEPKRPITDEEDTLAILKAIDSAIDKITFYPQHHSGQYRSLRAAVSTYEYQQALEIACEILRDVRNYLNDKKQRADAAFAEIDNDITERLRRLKPAKAQNSKDMGTPRKEDCEV